MSGPKRREGSPLRKRQGKENNGTEDTPRDGKRKRKTTDLKTEEPRRTKEKNQEIPKEDKEKSTVTKRNPIRYLRKPKETRKGEPRDTPC